MILGLAKVNLVTDTGDGGLQPDAATFIGSIASTAGVLKGKYQGITPNTVLPYARFWLELAVGKATWADQSCIMCK
jgi:hypothetical protein